MDFNRIRDSVKSIYLNRHCRGGWHTESKSFHIIIILVIIIIVVVVKPNFSAHTNLEFYQENDLMSPFYVYNFFVIRAVVAVR